MAQGYDADVQLSVGLSLDDVTSQARKLNQAVSKIFNNVDTSKLDNSHRKLLENMSKTQTQISKVGSEIDKLQQKKIDTDTYRQLYDQVAELATKYEELQKKEESALTIKERVTIRDEMKVLEDQATELGQQMIALEEINHAVWTADDEAKLEAYKNQLGDLNNTTRTQIQAFGEAGEASTTFGATASKAIKGLVGAMQKIVPIIGKVTNSILRLSGLGPVIDGVKNKVGALTSKLKGSSSAASNFGASFKRGLTSILKYGIGIASITSLFNKIRGVVTQNIQYFALFNNGVNQTNYAISSLQSSLGLLKGAFTSAFVPIVNVVSPILSNLIDQLASVITTIGMFIAKLTGAKSYMRAVKKNADYASSVSGGSKGKTAEEKYEEAVKKAQEKHEKEVAKIREKNAKAIAKAEEQNAKAAEKYAKSQEKANKQLAGFDELNVLTIEDLEEYEEVQAELQEEPELELPDREDFEDSGGGGSKAPFEMEEVPLDDVEWNWEDLKKKAEELGRQLADKLNDFFKNEDFAKTLGHNIAEALNTALHFVYGFVDQLDWKQMGRWLGVLVQEGIETFEWDLLGKTIGTFLNGVADTVIGFFETYNVGTLGKSIATMFNNAIQTLDPKKIGTAIKDVLQAPLIELREVLTETNWRLLGSKLSTWFHNVFSTEGLKSERLGITIGKTIGAAINAAVDFLLGLNIRQIVKDIALFLTDILVGAAEEINWFKFLEAIVHGIFGILGGIADAMAVIGGSMSVALQKAINEKLHIQIFDPEEIARTEKEIELLRQGFTTIGDVVDGTSESIANMYLEIDKGTQYSAKALLRMQEGGGLANEQIEDLITAMKEYARVNGETFDEVALGLEGYAGNWETFRNTVTGASNETTSALKETGNTVKELEKNAGELSKKSEEAGNTIQQTAEKTEDKLNHTASIGKDHLGILNSALDESDENAAAFSDSAVESLKKVDDKTTDTAVNFEGLSTELTTSLKGLNNIVDNWYKEIETKYFDASKWYDMINKSMVTSLEKCVDKMTKTWSTKMNAWKSGGINPIFNASYWTNIFRPIATAWEQTWDKVFKTFTTKYNSWWNSTLVPAFAQGKWMNEFNHVVIAADSAFGRLVDVIKNRMSQAISAVQSASSQMASAVSSATSALSKVQSSIDSVNGAMNATRDSLSALQNMDLSGLQKKVNSVQITIPKLAQGAVIPPNNEFLAVLGDQKAGTNIEAPLETIKQAFAETLGSLNFNRGNEDIVVQIDGYEVFRAVRNHSDMFRNSTGYGAL